MSPPRRSIAGLVLAGGQSARMGEDKALITWQGKSLLDRAAALLTDTGAAQVFIAGRPQLENGLADEAPGGGPARAILSAVKHLSRQHWNGLLIVPVDMPGLTPPALKPLIADPAQAAAFENMPLPLYLPLTSPPAAALRAERVTDLHKAWHAKALPRPEDSTVLANINAPEDLASWKQRHSD